MKFIVSIEEVCLGIYYKVEKNIMKIGGNKKFLLHGKHILEHYFEVIGEKIKFPSQNKFSIEVEMKLNIFDQGIDNLREMGIVVEQVTSLERIMR